MSRAVLKQNAATGLILLNYRAFETYITRLFWSCSFHCLEVSLSSCSFKSSSLLRSYSMSCFPPSKQNKATRDPTIIWCCHLVLDENAIIRGKKTNKHVYLSLREDISGVEGTQKEVQEESQQTGCSQLLPQCSSQKHPCQSQGSRQWKDEIRNA